MSNQDNPVIKVHLNHDVPFTEVPLLSVDLPKPATSTEQIAEQVAFLKQLQIWYFELNEDFSSWAPEYVAWVDELLNSNRVLVNTFAHYMNLRGGDDCVSRLAEFFGKDSKNAEVFRKYVNNETLYAAVREALHIHSDWLHEYDCIEFTEEDGKFRLQEYRVKYENNCGEDDIETFPTAEDAEHAIQWSVNAEQKDRFREQGTVTEFHHKVELDNPDSGEHAVWHKLWVLDGTSVQKEIFVAFTKYRGDLKELADRLSGEFNVTIARNSTLCFLAESGEELLRFLEKKGYDVTYSYESPEKAWAAEEEESK